MLTENVADKLKTHTDLNSIQLHWRLYKTIHSTADLALYHNPLKITLSE